MSGSIDRYDRQRRVREIGWEGQQRIRAAHVAIVGIGALGTVVADILSRSGAGTLTLIDGDCVELSNLQRQALFTEADARAGAPKATAAAARLREINSEPTYLPIVTELDAQNSLPLLAHADLMIDGSDNSTTRRILNETAHELNIPWVHGAALGTAGEVMTIVPGETPCYACYRPQRETEPAGGCGVHGVVAPVTHLVATLQSTEALRLIVGKAPSRGVRLVDPWQAFSQTVLIERREQCPVCVRGERPELRRPRRAVSQLLCGDGGWAVRPERAATVDLTGFARRLAPEKLLSRHESVVRFTVPESAATLEDGPPDEEITVTLFGDGRAHIRGAADETQAHRVYRDYVGV